MYGLKDKSLIAGKVRYLHGLFKEKKSFLLILILEHLKE